MADIPEDVRWHKRYHDKKVNGVVVRRAKSERVIWEEDAFRITLVNYESPLSQKKRAEAAVLLARQDTPYDFAAYHASEPADEQNAHVFLLYHRNHIVGLSVIEKRSHVWRCTWKQYESREPEELTDHPSIWSVGIIWVHRRHRRKGLAQRMFDEGTSFLGTNMQSVGWYTPFTELGEALVRRLYPAYFYIAK